MKARVTAGAPRQGAKASIAAAEAADLQRAMTAGQVANPTVDMDKACKTCGTMGATETGECLACVSKAAANKAAGKKDKPGRKPKIVQMEAVALVPKMDGVGKAAKRFAESLTSLDEARDERGEAEQNLINSLKKAKRTSFQTLGFKFFLNHSGPKDSIKVQKPK